MSFRVVLILQFIVWCVLSIPCLKAASAEKSNAAESNLAQKRPERKELDLNEGKKLLKILQEAEKARGLKQMKEVLTRYQREQVLNALAYALKEGKHALRACVVIYVTPELRDPRLVPFLAEAIKREKGQTLMCAIAAAKALADPRLVDVLLDYAVTSDYHRKRSCELGKKIKFIYNSAFAETANALYKITKGKIGIRVIENDRPHEELFPKAKRSALIDKWRRIWEASKKDKE